MEGVYSEFCRYFYLEKIRVGDLQISFAVTLAVIWISIAVFPAVLLFLSSYIYVPLPSYEPDITDIETEPGARAIITETSYIVEEEKGSFYWIAFDGTKQQIDEALVS